VTTSVLLVSAGVFHPPLLARLWLWRTLQALPGYHFRRVASLEALPGLPLDSFRAIVLYFHHKSISPSALASLDSFVQRGGGLLGIHSASASFKQEERYFALLGGRFRTHGPVQLIRVQPSTAHDEVFGKVTAFQIRDELYRHEYDSTNRVHFLAQVDDEHEPVVWTRSHGRGRVCYYAFGHTPAAMRDPHVQHILRRGLAWAGGPSPDHGVTP